MTANEKTSFYQKKPFEKVVKKQKISYFCECKTKQANEPHRSL